MYEKYKKERKIFGVGLVNIAKIAPSECQKNSLASKVICANETAQKYVNYIMGNVICVESENDLKKFERSITKTVMVYQNKASRQTKKEFYATPYIGRESRKIRLQAIIEQLESLAEELKAKNERKSALQNLQRNQVSTPENNSIPLPNFLKSFSVIRISFPAFSIISLI